MIVLRDTDSLKVFYPRLTIRATLTLTELYGNPLQPLANRIPKMSDLVFILSLCLAEYNLSDDKIYDIIDTVDNLPELILELYVESGLINQDDNKDKAHDDVQSDTADNEQPLDVDVKQQIDELLEQCMSIGMTEKDFYGSTFKQVKRYAESYTTREKLKMQEQAFFDYQLANMIGTSVARLFSNDVQYPSIDEAYPGIFNDTNNKETQTPSEERKLGVVDKQAWDDGLTPEQRAEEIAFIRRMEQMEAMNRKLKEKQEKESKGE